MIEWKPCAEVPRSESTQIGSLQCLVVVHKHEGEYAWHVLVALDVLGSLTCFPLLGANGHRSPTLDAAKSAAEQFAREWVAAQAAALGDGGEWTSALPHEEGWYWVYTGTPSGPRLEFLTLSTSLDYWGETFQRWSVPVEPPLLPEVADEP